MIAPKRFYPHRPKTLAEMMKQAVAWFIKTQGQFPECLVVSKALGAEALELMPVINKDMGRKFGDKLQPIELRVNGGTLRDEVWVVVGDEARRFREAK